MFIVLELRLPHINTQISRGLRKRIMYSASFDDMHYEATIPVDNGHHVT